MSGWHKTDVEGRVMWESPEGERVMDSSLIPGMQKRAAQINDQIDAGAGFVAVVFLLGCFVGAFVTYAILHA